MPRKPRLAPPQIGFSKRMDDSREELEHLRELRSYITIGSRLIWNTQHPTPSAVKKIALTGTLRRLETIIEKGSIEIIAIPRQLPISRRKQLERLDPESKELNTNTLRVRLDKMKLRRTAGIHIIGVKHLEDPAREVITMSAALNRGLVGSEEEITIYLVPGINHWGINRIATSGDEEFNKWAQSQKPDGMLPPAIQVIEQKMVNVSGKKPKEVKARTEKDVFELCGINYIPVSYRTDNLWRVYIEEKLNIPQKKRPKNIDEALENIKKTLE
jgi:hypothetical protein